MKYWDDWIYWNGCFTKPVKKYYKISICTTCMDRLFTLKEVFPVNIKDNLDYPNLEYVILDYNSKDNLSKWIKNNMMQYIESGLLNYYRTTEPKYYSMSHSRNVAFKLAQGEIVNNVDADNYTNPGFVHYINRLANEHPKKAIFAKGKRLLRGRIGFYKNEFMDILGGYDEDMEGYGYDDKDLFNRAMCSGFMLMWYGGAYVRRIKTPKSMVGKNMKNPKWRETEKINKEISDRKLEKRIYKANQNRHWGKATVTKNFTEEIRI